MSKLNEGVREIFINSLGGNRTVYARQYWNYCTGESQLPQAHGIRDKDAQQIRIRLAHWRLPETEAYVFSNHDGTPVSPNYFSIMWSRAVARAGLPDVTFHSLRHSHASA